MKLKTTKLRVMEVHWLDHSASSGWVRVRDIRESESPVSVVSVGILVDETPDTIVLAVSYSYAPGVHGCAERACIHKGLITRKRVVGRIEIA